MEIKRDSPDRFCSQAISINFSGTIQVSLKITHTMDYFQGSLILRCPPESKASFLCLVQNKHITRSVYEASEAILRRVIQVRRNRPIPDEGHRLRLAVLVIRPGHGDCPTIGNAVDGQLHCARSGGALIALRCRFRRLKWSHPRKEAAAESHTVRIKCWPPLAFTFRPRNSNFFSQNYQRHCPFLTDSEKSCIF